MFPLLSSAQKVDELTSPFRWISDLVRFVGSFLPDFASTWVDGYARAPFWFAGLAILVTGLLYGVLQDRVAHRQTSWRRSGGKTPQAPTGLPDNFVYRLRSNGLTSPFTRA